MMENEVSVFIMNVNHPSQEDIGHELSEYLQQLQVSIAYWTQYISPTKVVHRAGDELVVISNGYGSAYTLAFYLSRIWRFTAHQPYFGLSFGHIKEDINTLNIETWIHPLMKHAKKANNAIEKDKKRTQFHFSLPSLQAEKGLEIYNKQFEALLNTCLSLKQELLNDQTDIQSLVCSLYLLLGKQNKVSEYLDRTRSTISTHIKKGKTDDILKTFYNIVQVLISLEVEQENREVDELQTNIRQNVTHRLQDYLPNERSSK